MIGSLVNGTSISPSLWDPWTSVNPTNARFTLRLAGDFGWSQRSFFCGISVLIDPVDPVDPLPLPRSSTGLWDVRLVQGFAGLTIQDLANGGRDGLNNRPRWPEQREKAQLPLPSNRTWRPGQWPIDGWFTIETWWFSIALFNYRMVYSVDLVILIDPLWLWTIISSELLTIAWIIIDYGLLWAMILYYEPQDFSTWWIWVCLKIVYP